MSEDGIAPAATNRQYSGYDLLSYHDILDQTPFPVEHVRSQREEEAPLDKAELEKAEAKLGRHFLANSSVFFFGTLLLLGLVGLIPAASCAFQLCSKQDKSASGKTGLQLFNFFAPLHHVWALFTTGAAGMFAACIHFFVLRSNPLGRSTTILAGMRIRTGNHTFLKYAYFVQGVVALPIFLLVGFGVSWFSAGTFLFGILVATLVGWISIYVASYGSLCTLTGAEDSFSKAMQLMFRSSVTYTCFSLSICILGVALGYLVFQDVRGLLGLSAGISTIALLSRVSSGIFCAASDMARRVVRWVERNAPIDDPRNPSTISAQVGESVDEAGGTGLDLVESFTPTVVLAAISATMLPYIHEDRYALCVYNNLHIDYGCIGFENNTQLVSFAAQICRQGDLYQSFPSLGFSESNSLFVAVPFLVAILGTMVILLCSVRLVSQNYGSSNVDSDRFARVRRIFRFQSAIASVLFFVGCVAISFGLFGTQSNFQKVLSSNSFPRREFSTNVVPDKCIPIQDLTGLTGSNLPRLLATTGAYRATNELGELFPPPSGIPWRILVVLVVGQVLAITLETIMGFFTDYSHIPTNTVAKMSECGTEDAIIQGLGTALTASALPFMFTLSAALGCHYLLGGYGIALGAVSMMSASGMSFVLGTTEVIAKGSGCISRVNRSSIVAQRTMQVMDWVGGTFSLVTKSVNSAAAFLVSSSLVSDLMLVSHLIPTAKDIIGASDVSPVRHVKSADSLIAISPNVVVSALFGVLLPVTFVALPLLGMSRTGYALIVEARKQVRELARTPSSGSPLGTTDRETSSVKKCVRISTRYALFETLLPLLIILVAPLVVGFGLGQRALIGFLLSTSSCAYLLSVLFITAGSSWNNARRTLQNGNEEYEVAAFSSRCASVADDVGLFLKRTSTPGLAIYTKLVSLLSVFTVTIMQADGSLWYIGVSILAGAVTAAVGILTLSYKQQKKIRIKAGDLFQQGPIEPVMNVDNEIPHVVSPSPFYADTTLLPSRRRASNETTQSEP